ncbi:hypothetical protein [Nocardia asiatica]|uniref:hypothetical protein n=1 Tax=Nocardia asiatica TaxID=209252 RepID=UPI0002EC8C79|nr:hypothetical protein [Nocardia asiatica]
MSTNLPPASADCEEQTRNVSVNIETCGIPWCVACVISTDLDDHPHRHQDQGIAFEVAHSPYRLSIERSCRVYGDGLRSTTIDIVSDDRSGFGVCAIEALQLADLLHDPGMHYQRESVMELAEAPGFPLIVRTSELPSSDPRDYLLHITQYGCEGEYCRLTATEREILGTILRDLGNSMA